jgi:hypothetical protein
MAEHGHSHEITIHIDKKTYKVDSTSQTGLQLRELGGIGTNYDLYEEVPGGQDKPIEDTDTVELKDGMHFFSVEKSINPGR